MNIRKKGFQVPNYRKIDVYYKGATDYRGSRICISENSRFYQDKTQRKYFSYCHKHGNIMEQAYEILINNGFNVICRASDKDKYYFFCDNWSDDFKEIKNLKNY